MSNPWGLCASESNCLALYAELGSVKAVEAKLGFCGKTIETYLWRARKKMNMKLVQACVAFDRWLRSGGELEKFVPYNKDSRKVMTAYMQTMTQPMTRGELAEATGINKETVSNVLTTMWRAGEIHRPVKGQWMWGEGQDYSQVPKKPKEIEIPRFQRVASVWELGRG